MTFDLTCYLLDYNRWVLCLSKDPGIWFILADVQRFGCIWLITFNKFRFHSVHRNLHLVQIVQILFKMPLCCIPFKLTSLVLLFGIHFRRMFEKLSNVYLCIYSDIFIQKHLIVLKELSLRWKLLKICLQIKFLLSFLSPVHKIHFTCCSLCFSICLSSMTTPPSACGVWLWFISVVVSYIPNDRGQSQCVVLETLRWPQATDSQTDSWNR